MATTIPEWITAVAAASGIPVATLALLFAARQLRGERRATEGQRQIAQAQFLLALDDAFRQHEATHRKFRPATGTPTSTVGLWHGRNARGPTTPEEWADVEAYMGLFERVNVMIDQRLLDVAVIQRLRGYRVTNILTNPFVMKEKLTKRADDWDDFIALAKRLNRWPNDAGTN